MWKLLFHAFCQYYNTNMRICFFSSDFPPTVGGISTYNEGLTRALSLHNKISHVQVVALQNPEKGVISFGGKMSVVRERKQPMLFLFLAMWRYCTRFRHYDIFHTTNLFPIGFFLVLTGKYMLRKPVFLTVHGTDVLTKEGSFFTKQAKSFTLRAATHIIAVSHSTKKELCILFPFLLNKISVIHFPFSVKKGPVNIPNRAHIRLRKGFSQNDFLILTVTNLVKRKGVSFIIQTLTSLPKHSKLIIVGDGPERKNLEGCARKLGVHKRVFFEGKVECTEEYYRMADVFILASYFLREEGDIEGLGLVLLEAAHCGLPTIGTKSGGIPEAIQDGDSGFVVPERDARALKEKIKLLMSDFSLRKRMGERGRKFVKEKFDAEKSTDAHVMLYKKFLAHNTK